MDYKKITFGLGTSAVAMGAFAGWMVLQTTKSAGSRAGTDTAGAALHNSGASAGQPLPSATAGGESFVWSSIETSDYKIYIANLRRIKCPEATIRDIIIAEIDRYYAPREAPFKPDTKSVASVGGKTPPETAAQKRARLKQDYERRRSLRGIEVEKAAVLKQLLDYDLPLEPLRGWHTRNYERFEAAINSVPPEKRERVRAIQEAYWELSDALNDERADKLQGNKTPEYVKLYKENNEKRLAALGQALTPQELETYEMRCSSVANRLAGSLSDFKPTEDEFRTIWRTRHEIEEPFGGMMTAGSADTKVDPQKELDAAAKLKQDLGEDRYAAYQRSMDPNFQTLSQLRTRFNLSQEAVDQAYTIFQQNPQIFQNGGQKIEIVDGRQVVTPPPQPPKEALEKLKNILGGDPYTIVTANTPWANTFGP